ncbi:MAG: 3,4-dihydroxy-2-butanone-4-phosphate synthase [bacterium]|nr:3,4-dihydroxy-2-butanone-4-phosphate synthase [bacterium]
MNKLSTIKQAIDQLQSGGLVIVIDDEGRENEGDLVIAAEYISEEKMAFIIRQTGGVVCLSLSNAIADQLDLPPMVRTNTSQHKTSFTESIEASVNVTTGISAHDRAQTILAAINCAAAPEDLCRPGHVFPLRAKDGGVLIRAGHTEASVDLCILAGLRAGAVISELMHEDGTMMRLPALQEFATLHEIPIVSIADLIAYRHQKESFIRREAETILETKTGQWRMIVYKDTTSDAEHVALIKGVIDPMIPTLVRVHSECLTGDAFGSVHCDCGGQLDAAMQKIAKEDMGVVVYMKQEGRGIGLTNKVKAYELQRTEGVDTVEANTRLGLPSDLRTYGIGAQILKDVGVGNIRMLTNNPKKIVGLDGYGLHIVEQVRLEQSELSKKQRTYLQTKKEKMGHWLENV